MDTAPLKRNMPYALCTNCKMTDVAVMNNAVEAVFEHHFNNHTACGPWCCVKKIEGKEREEAELNNRSKVKNKQFYLQVKEIFDDFLVLMHEMMHKWDTNIVEGLNKLFAKFLPKGRAYARTIENKVRLYLAVAIDSQGYAETYRRMAGKTGLTLTSTHMELNRQLDSNKSYSTGECTGRSRSYRKEDSVKLQCTVTVCKNSTRN
jgi:hypothetical protein